MKGESTVENQQLARQNAGGFSLFEVILVIVIIGVLAAVAIPIAQGLGRVSASKSKRNAQMAAEVSNNLVALDVAHVLPESLGGVEATTRLLKLGIKVEDGSMEGVTMSLPGLQESEIKPTSTYLRVVFDEQNLRLEYDAEGVE